WGTGESAAPRRVRGRCLEGKTGREALDRPGGADDDLFRRGAPWAAIGPWLWFTGPGTAGCEDLGTVRFGSHWSRFRRYLAADVNRLRDEGGDEGEADDARHNPELRH